MNQIAFPCSGQLTYRTSVTLSLSGRSHYLLNYYNISYTYNIVYCLRGTTNRAHIILYTTRIRLEMLCVQCAKSRTIRDAIAYGTYIHVIRNKSRKVYILRQSVPIYIYLLYVLPYIMYGYITNGDDNDRSPDAILGNDTRERAKILTWLIACTRHGPNSILLFYSSV